MHALMTRKSCAVGMRNAILRNYLKAMLEVKYRTEMYLASKNNKVKQFQAKWQLYINARDIRLV